MAIAVVMVLLSTMSFTNKSSKDLVKKIENDLNTYLQNHPPMPDNKTYFDIGEVVNIKMKSLANGSPVDLETADKNITAIKKGSALPSGFTPSEANTVSANRSAQPIYIWWDSSTTTIYYYSADTTIYLNKIASYLCYRINNLTDISGLSSLNTSYATTMRGMFNYCTKLTNIDALSSWNTSNVTNMRGMFYACKALTNINGASSWNTAKVTTLIGMFQECSALADISGASNWNTSNVTSMYTTFYYCGALPNINALSSWNTSKVTDMRRMFQRCTSLTNINGMSNWDTSKLKQMDYMFYYCSKASGTIKLLGNPTSYADAFNSAATESGAQITVNYADATTNIDNIIATKSDTSNVVKGSKVS